MNRLLSVLSIGILVAAGNLTASGQISREVGKDAGSIQLKETPRGIKLSPDMLKMRHQSAESTSGNAIGEVSFLKQTPRARNGSRVSKRLCGPLHCKVTVFMPAMPASRDGMI
jgi:hypothetical protein